MFEQERNSRRRARIELVSTIEKVGRIIKTTEIDNVLVVTYVSNITGDVVTSIYKCHYYMHDAGYVLEWQHKEHSPLDN